MRWLPSSTHELVVAVGDDQRRRLPALLDALLRGPRRRRATRAPRPPPGPGAPGGPGQAVELVERELDRAEPAVGALATASRRARGCRCPGWRGTRPPSRPARRASAAVAGRVDGVGVCRRGHGRAGATRPASRSSACGLTPSPSRWSASLNEWSVHWSSGSSWAHSVSPVLVGRSWRAGRRAAARRAGAASTP